MINKEMRVTSSIFSKLNILRNEVKEGILGNQDLLKLLAFAKDDPLNEPDIENPWSIVNGDGNVFFQPRAINAVSDDKSILVMNTAVKGTSGTPNYAEIFLSFYILVNYSSGELIDGTDRLFRICECLDDVFGHSEGSWIGKMEFKDGRDITVPTSHHGVSLTFAFTQFK